MISIYSRTFASSQTPVEGIQKPPDTLGLDMPADQTIIEQKRD